MTPLRQRMLEDMRIRNLAENTQRSYLLRVGCFARHFGRSPEQLGPEDIRAYQIHLLNGRKLAPSSIGITCAALRFLYHDLKAGLGARGDPAPEEATDPASGSESRRGTPLLGLCGEP